MLVKVIVCIVAGLGAGVGTGLSGLSAAAVISPMLITFLGFDAYEAVGIALASDVLASAASAYTYGKNKNLDIKNGLVMLASVLVFTLVGSFAASKISGGTMGTFSIFMTLLLGVKFIVKPVMTTKEKLEGKSRRARILQSILCGIVMILCIVFTLVGAEVAARFANKAPAKTLNRVTGIVLAVLGAVMLTVRFL